MCVCWRTLSNPAAGWGERLYAGPEEVTGALHPEEWQMGNNFQPPHRKAMVKETRQRTLQLQTMAPHQFRQNIAWQRRQAKMRMEKRDAAASAERRGDKLS